MDRKIRGKLVTIFRNGWLIEIHRPINQLTPVEHSVEADEKSIVDNNIHKATLTEIIAWFFALDNPNYARCLSVHIQDMFMLDTKYPCIAERFREGKFTVSKTHNSFSSIAIDYSHEQKNALKEIE